jgi:hypothetical protein
LSVKIIDFTQCLWIFLSLCISINSNQLLSVRASVTSVTDLFQVEL